MKESPKKTWTSKTVGANLLGAPLIYQSAIEIFPGLGVWVSSHPQSLILGMAFLNVVMRHFTAGGLTLKRIKND